MRVGRVAVVAVVFAAGCSDPKYAFDEGTVRSRIEERTGLTGDPLDDMVDQARQVCKIKGMNEFQNAIDRIANEGGADAVNDVVSGCPQRVD